MMLLVVVDGDGDGDGGDVRELLLNCNSFTAMTKLVFEVNQECVYIKLAAEI